MLADTIVLRDSEINELFERAVVDDADKIADIFAYIQPHIERTVFIMTQGENSDSIVETMASMSFLYAGLLKQVNQLFAEMEQKYEQSNHAKWYPLLKQCARLRQDIQTIYGLLQQTKMQENTHYDGLTDWHLQQAVVSTVKKYGAI